MSPEQHASLLQRERHAFAQLQGFMRTLANTPLSDHKRREVWRARIEGQKRYWWGSIEALDRATGGRT